MRYADVVDKRSRGRTPFSFDVRLVIAAFAQIYSFARSCKLAHRKTVSLKVLRRQESRQRWAPSNFLTRLQQEAHYQAKAQQMRDLRDPFDDASSNGEHGGAKTTLRRGHGNGVYDNAFDEDRSPGQPVAGQSPARRHQRRRDDEVDEDDKRRRRAAAKAKASARGDDDDDMLSEGSRSVAARSVTTEEGGPRTAIVVAAADDDIGANRLRVSQRKGKSTTVLDADSRTAMQTLRKKLVAMQADAIVHDAAVHHSQKNAEEVRERRASAVRRSLTRKPPPSLEGREASLEFTARKSKLERDMADLDVQIDAARQPEEFRPRRQRDAGHATSKPRTNDAFLPHTQLAQSAGRRSTTTSRSGRSRKSKKASAKKKSKSVVSQSSKRSQKSRKSSGAVSASARSEGDPTTSESVFVVCRFPASDFHDNNPWLA